jgi:colanic acid biosynthesis glycosyl transferase WcaI
VLALAEDPRSADELGSNGPRYADAHLSRAAGLDRIDALVAEVLGTSPPARQSGPVPFAESAPVAEPAHSDT